MVSQILESAEEIVGKIAAAGHPRDEVEAKIREKQEEYGGLLTRAGAAYAIAKELDVDVGLGDVKHEPVKIGQIKAGLEGVDVDGEIAQVFPPKAWEKDGRKGKVGSVIISDGTGQIRITLWNAECDRIENGELQRGAKVKVTNGSARERNGLAELALGHGGELKVLSPGKADVMPLAEIAEGMNDVSFAARVERVYPVKEFERKDGKGKVLTLIVSDGTERRLALWDENAKWDGKLREGDTILVEGAYVKMNRGKPELNLGRRGRVVLNPAGVGVSGTKRLELGKIRSGDTAEIRATVVKVYPPALYDVCSSCGKRHDGECCGPARKAMVVNAELDDGTGVVRGVFFRQQAEKLLGFSAEQYAKDASAFDERKIVGEEMLFTGTARHNEVYGRDEFIVRGFQAVEVEREIQMLKGE